MAQSVEVRIPDIGSEDAVDVIEIMVAIGDTVDMDAPLITLESDKASMDVPSPLSGTISELICSVGDKVKQGDVILNISTSDEQSAPRETEPTPVESPDSKAETLSDRPGRTASTAANSASERDTELLVIGSGPGGYTAAFRAADLGLQVTLVEKYEQLGGVCLNVGCIPSKALLHTASVIAQAREMGDHGVTFGQPKIDINKLRSFKESVIGKLTGGLKSMAKARNVNVVQGVANFTDSHMVTIASEGSSTTLTFDRAIIAAGSRSTIFPAFDVNDERVIDSTGALELPEIPKRLLIVGGGIIGLEMATVFSELGSEVTVVEFLEEIMPGADTDLVRILKARLRKQLKAILTSTKVESIEPKKSSIKVTFSDLNKVTSKATTQEFDYVLTATGRTPNGLLIDAEKAGVNVDEKGFIQVDHQMRTNVAHIFAIGDIVGQPMLAHKATHEAKVAAEVCAGHKSAMDARVIPSVAYTDPEIAWVGLTETQAKAKGISYEVGAFPWAASGRAIGNDRTDGKTKLLIDEETDRVLGVGIVGTNAGELIGEVALAIELGAEVSDIGLTIHPHPTLSESVAMAAEVYEGTITDLYLPKSKK